MAYFTITLTWEATKKEACATIRGTREFGMALDSPHARAYTHTLRSYQFMWAQCYLLGNDTQLKFIPTGKYGAMLTWQKLRMGQ